MPSRWQKAAEAAIARRFPGFDPNGIVGDSPTGGPIGTNGAIGTIKREDQESFPQEESPNVLLDANSAISADSITDGVARLAAMQMPADIPSARWAQLLLDARRLVAEGWAARALQLGWDVPDLFGCHPQKPYARISYQGLVWALNGDAIAALTKDAAALIGKSGSRLVYYRHPLDPDCVLVWTLKDLAPTRK